MTSIEDLIPYLVLISVIVLEIYMFPKLKEIGLNMAVFGMVALTLYSMTKSGSLVDNIKEFLDFTVLLVLICFVFCIIIPRIIPEKENERITTTIRTIENGNDQESLQQSYTAYHEILRKVHETGKTMERSPSTYLDKDEESLRDSLLIGFRGTAFGEAVNNQGKTDILIRVGNTNVLIAECKCWKGKEYYLNAITQLLGYLTWRDTRAATIIFTRQKSFSSVLQTVEEVTSSHPNYLELVGKEDESWFNYRFRNKDDPKREINIAVLLFHFPQ